MGLGYIDVVLDPAQAKKLYESLQAAKEAIEAIPQPQVENIEGLSYDEQSRISDSKLSKAREEFGTLGVDGEKIMAVVQDEDYRGLGPKILLAMEAMGKRGPEGSAPIDIAISAEDAKNLIAKLEEDMNSIEGALKSEAAIEN